jgi:hypothetical protein
VIEKMDLQPCRVKGVFVSVSEGGAAAPAVILEVAGGDCIPIFIGLYEAISIRNALNQEVLPRPITHDLFVEALSRFGIEVTALHIDALEENVFYAKLIAKSDGAEELIDCRPSDGIAIALRCHAPILVDGSVVSTASQPKENLPRLEDLDRVI